MDFKRAFSRRLLSKKREDDSQTQKGRVLDSDISAAGLKLPGIVIPPNFKINQPNSPRNIFLHSPEKPLSNELHERAWPGPKRQTKETGHHRLRFAREEMLAETARLEMFQAYSDVVDHDPNDEFEDYLSEELLGQLLLSHGFQLFITAVILSVSVLCGLGTSDALMQNYSVVFDLLDNIFLTVFTLEMLLKWFNGFVQFWKVGWNIFDFTLVFVSVLGNLLGSQLSFLSSGRILRIFRVLRAFRSLRSITAMKSLQMIVETIIDSLPDMMNIVMLLLIVFFIFAVVAVDLFGTKKPQYFGSLEAGFYTLFIMTTQDGWETIFWDISDAGLFLPAAVFFLSFIVVSAFVFVNILVGVVVINLSVAYRSQNSEGNPVRSLIGGEKKHKKPTETGKLLDAVDIGVVKSETWRSQEALQLPDFTKVSPAALENYFLVLLAIEDNLAEYKRMKSQVRTALDMIKEANEDSSSDLDESESEEEEEEEDPEGDVISKLIRREERIERKDRERTLRGQRKLSKRDSDDSIQVEPYDVPDTDLWRGQPMQTPSPTQEPRQTPNHLLVPHSRSLTLRALSLFPREDQPSVANPDDAQSRRPSGEVPVSATDLAEALDVALQDRHDANPPRIAPQPRGVTAGHHVAADPPQRHVSGDIIGPDVLAHPPQDNRAAPMPDDGSEGVQLPGVLGDHGRIVEI